MSSEIVFLITEQRNKQRIALASAKAPYRFGRSAQCEYVLRRNNVGDRQFTIACAEEQWTITDDSSDCNTWYNNRYLQAGETCALQPGDVIGLNTDGDATTQEITFRVEEIRSAPAGGSGLRQEQTEQAVLREVDVRRKKRVLIGRADDCDIKLVSDRVSRHHCEILYRDGQCEVRDLGSTNGTYVDGVRVSRAPLRNGAVINVPTQVFAFTAGMLHYHQHKSGISVQLLNVYKTVDDRNTGKPLNIVDGTSFEIEPNSFVVLVGGSGTGKSSLLTCITGTDPCTAGSVRFDGLDTRGNRNAFDAVLGYVPQRDIMHDNLTLEQSLTYAAQLRIAHDATRAEIAAAVAHAIEAVDLTGREKTMISQLSGGQKKRVSIAMELLASPRLLVLDEPTSGLSPDLDRSMMELCRKLSHQNCTVLMVTHNMSNINLCDKIAFLGTGGVLCYYGTPEELLPYFEVEMTSDIFEKLRVPELVEQYRRQYFTTPEFNRLVAAWPEAAQEAKKRCSQSNS
ncbi:FHA domain-containing protein [uncultured Subdoligranulum sp.]|uniref:FHA domain-containing protein n=1 Tax=Candidatus Gemmiger excrementavium TaxID=2838608 RepID=A0A9D2F422_9FIRM|nr:FHA domain-containing protein [uncultured Subdoligranulum sp.]HIZ48795.1 FHA domain-containing protein [Candidatus Gemmiger excrementavium]